VIPEEDLPPAWLRDFGSIEVDIRRMEEFAASLENELRQSYMPHLDEIKISVSHQLPKQHSQFAELFGFLEAHRDAQQDTVTAVYAHRDATGGFAVAAQEVSKNYGNADAFAAARQRDVQAALDQTAVAKVPPRGSTPASPPTTSAPPVVTPVTPPTDQNGGLL
jgi:hypothetical protein